MIRTGEYQPVSQWLKNGPKITWRKVIFIYPQAHHHEGQVKDRIKRKKLTEHHLSVMLEPREPDSPPRLLAEDFIEAI